jgi:hypothetical protein
VALAAVAAGHGPGLIPLILIGAGVIVAYVLVALGHPLVRCPACFGRRVRRPHRGRGRGGRLRARKCGFCRANGLIRLPGATAVHSYFWSVFGDHIQDKRRAENAGRLNSRKWQ